MLFLMETLLRLVADGLECEAFCAGAEAQREHSAGACGTDEDCDGGCAGDAYNAVWESPEATLRLRMIGTYLTTELTAA